MSEQPLRHAVLQQVTALLDGGQAHVSFADVVTGIPLENQGIVPPGLPYSAWQLLEHLRIAQRDILDFSDSERRTYVPLEWPAQYWPADPAPPTPEAWDSTIHQIQSDRREFESLLQHRDLTEPFPWGDGQTMLRQALLIADHNSYHLGEMVAVRRLLGLWSAA